MRPAKPGQPLVEREVQVLKGIASGASYAEIAAELHLAHATVKNYATSVITKLGARSRAHAVHLAHGEGILRRERHGDHAGFAAHIYRDEEPCDDCWAGERAYRTAQRRKRHQEGSGGARSAQEPAGGARDVRGAAGPSGGRTAARGEVAA